jgi:hypothetical protein
VGSSRFFIELNHAEDPQINLCNPEMGLYHAEIIGSKKIRVCTVQKWYCTIQKSLGAKRNGYVRSRIYKFIAMLTVSILQSS